MAKPEFLTVPPVEAVEHFRGKGYHVGFDWRDTDAAEHLRSFTVAKAMRLDILENIRDAVDDVIGDGLTFRQFRQQLEPILRSKGWWGRQELVDPMTGEARLVQLGSPRRLRTIFDTNIRMATAHGRWERIQRLKGVMPHLRYVAVLDARTRPEHARWHGTVLPVDHPWWQTHFPPNGWHCRCIVVQLSDDDLRRYGYSVSPDPAVRTREWLNKRTGEVHQVPQGIDPGFAHNVGAIDPGLDGHRLLQQARATAEESGANVPRGLDDYIALGRRERQALVAAAGGVDAPDFADRARSELRRRLRDERGAGTVDPDLTPYGNRDRTATERMRRALQDLPATWLRAGNDYGRVYVRGSRSQGGYYRVSERLAVIGGSGMQRGLDVALHEYTHHLQQAMPPLQALFREEHLRRTTDADGRRHRVLVTKGYQHSRPRVVGRDDDYVLPYAGRAYRWDRDDPQEVLTVHMQAVLQSWFGDEKLRDIARDDPGMLDLLLGVLFHYDP